MSMVVTLPDEEAQKLNAAAVRLGVSVDEVARTLVADHLPAVTPVERSRALLESMASWFTNRSCTDQPAQASGIIVCVHSDFHACRDIPSTLSARRGS